MVLHRCNSVALTHTEIEKKIASLEQAIAAADNINSLRPHMPRLPNPITINGRAVDE